MVSTGRPKSSKSKKSVQPASVLDFWEGQAKTHGSSDLATNPDQHYRKLEIESILRVIGTLVDNKDILDVGCGNGYTTKMIAEKFPEAHVTGIDFSPEMVKEASRLASDQMAFYEGDVLSLSRNSDLGAAKFDVIVCTRCLINLANFEEQKVAILEMRKMLKPEGRIILVENVMDGLDRLNHLRDRFGLEPIKLRWHNYYMPEAETTKFFNDIRGHLLTCEYVENIGNFYYMASRVIYAKLCKDQGVEPDYNNPINNIASQMPTMGEYYACSPNYMFVLKNEAGAGWDRKLSS